MVIKIANPRITDEELKILEEYIGKEVSVKTAYATYDFSERLFDGKKIFCSGKQVSSRAPRYLRKVETEGIVIEDIGIPGRAVEDEKIILSESRHDGSVFLGGVNAETYTLEMITRIECDEEVIFQKKPEDYMPEDIKEKLQTYKCVPLPP